MSIYVGLGFGQIASGCVRDMAGNGQVRAGGKMPKEMLARAGNNLQDNLFLFDGRLALLPPDGHFFSFQV